MAVWRLPQGGWGLHFQGPFEHTGLWLSSCQPHCCNDFLVLFVPLTPAVFWTGVRIQWNKLGKINSGGLVLRNCGIGFWSACLSLLTLWFWELTTDHKSKNHPVLLAPETWHHFSTAKHQVLDPVKRKSVKNSWLCNLIIFKLRLQEKFLLRGFCCSSGYGHFHRL